MESSEIIAVDEENFRAEVLEESRPVLLDFGAHWCGPCKALDPIAASIAAEYTGRLKVVAIDADRSPALATRYQVRAMPTLIVLDRGQEVRRHVGLTSRQKVIALFADRIAKA